MRSTHANRVLAGLAALAIAAGGAAWTGCDDDGEDARQAADEVLKEGEEALKQAEEEGEKAEKEIDQALEEDSGGGGGGRGY